MTHLLTVEENDTRTIYEDTTETHARAQINGTLEINGTLVLTDEEPTDLSLNDQTDALDFPQTMVLRSMNMGLAIFLVGLMGLMLFASWIMDNYVAGALWSLSLVVLILVGVFQLPLEIYWMSVVGVILTIVLGFIVRWTGF